MRGGGSTVRQATTQKGAGGRAGKDKGAAPAAKLAEEPLFIKALLNRLTTENFDELSDQILAWVNKSEQEKDGETIIVLTKLILEKATDQAVLSEIYARLCRKLLRQISPNVRDDSVKDSHGRPVVGGRLFCKYLLNVCQEAFERGSIAKERAATAGAGKAAGDVTQKAYHESNNLKGTALYDDEHKKVQLRWLGVVNFIAELFKVQMCTERIMHECVKCLLRDIKDPPDEEIEGLCCLLVIAGPAMDNVRALDHMNVYFNRMAELVKNNKISPRIRSMVQVSSLCAFLVACRRLHTQ